MSTPQAPETAPDQGTPGTPTKAAQRSEHEAIARKSSGPMGHGPMGMGRVNEKAVSFRPSMKRLLAHFRPERGLLIIIVAMGVVSVIASVVGPKILGRATDYIVAGVVGRGLPGGLTKEQLIAQLNAQGQTDFAKVISQMPVVPGQGINFHALGVVIAWALGLYLASGLLALWQGWILNGVVQRTIYRLRKSVSEKLDRLPLSYFDAQPRGELLSRVTNDIDNIAQTMQQTFSQLLVSLLTIIGVLIMMLTVSPLLTLVTLAILPLSGVVAALIGKRSQKQFVAMWAATGKLNAQIEEAYTGHALVKVFGRQREVEQEFANRNGALYQASFRAQFLTGMMMPLMFFIGNLGYVAIAVVGGVRVAQGALPLGSVQAFIQYSRMFTQPLSQVASMANMLQSGVASAERVFEVLDTPEVTPDEPGTLPTPTQGRVAFEHVKFSYTPEQHLISDLSLIAEPGQTIAIVGPTGAGKTTLVNLLERFYELDGGRITLDGTDISTVPRNQLRSRMGMVLQDTWLFGGTIRENIAYGRPDATEEEIVAASAAAYVDRFVHTLPDGYDTVIDEEGSNISTGERQLVTIARAFLADPNILILDEATSSVDTRTEVLVQQAMNALRSGRTSFVIAHRLSTIRDADLILVMEHGDIVEQGSHRELLAAKGAYYDLYQTQFSAPMDEELVDQT